MINVINVNLLLELPEGYHLLPPGDTAQEETFALPKLRKGLHGYSNTTFKYNVIPQKDGSRFKLVRKYLTPSHIIEKLYDNFPDILPILPQSPWKNDIVIYEGDIEYKFLFYWTHTFLNGYRGFPILLNEQLYTFWDLSPVFPELIPEDEWGILVPSINELSTHGALAKLGLPEPIIIKYLAAKRLCHCCGIVSDFSKPRATQPWLTYYQRVNTRGEY